MSLWNNEGRRMIERVTVAVLCRPVRLLRNTLIAGTLLSSTTMSVTQRPIRISESPGADHRSLWCRRHRRRRDAHSGGPADWSAETTIRRGESSGSRGNRRCESRGVRCSRWLYRVDDWQQQRHQRVPFQITALQHSYRLRLDLDDLLL